MARKHITDVMVCEACDAFHHPDPDITNRPDPLEYLCLRTGQSPKVCWRAMERACSRNLIEWGVSLRYAWVTPKGRALLASAGPDE